MAQGPHADQMISVVATGHKIMTGDLLAKKKKKTSRVDLYSWRVLLGVVDR